MSALQNVLTVQDIENEELSRGSHLGPYLIRRLLTYGGMSRIYLAYDEYSYETVAIKVVCTQGMSYEEAALQVEQFRGEQRIMRFLHHPNILPLLDAGRQGDYLYLVMPYVQNGSLQDRLDQEFLSIAEAGAIFEQVANALDYMHTRGVLHRDIKPANILLNDDGSIYLTDFGLATPIGESILSERGCIAGTPIYMSPELCSGHVSVSSDIYALGVLLYQMLTGVVPFDGSTAMHVCLRQMREQPARPSQYNADISYCIEQVVLRALEKEVADRFQSVDAFLDAYTRATRTPHLLDKFYAYWRQAELVPC